jgi:hypothetical protein
LLVGVDRPLTGSEPDVPDRGHAHQRPPAALVELALIHKRRALYGRYPPTGADLQAAIQEILDGLPTTHAASLKTLMALNSQKFEDVLLISAQGIGSSD